MGPAPAGAGNLTDRDAPGATFLHWSVYGIGPEVGRFKAGSVPSGALEGANDAGGEGYAPPCPPQGDDPHRYVLSLRPEGRLDGRRPPGSAIVCYPSEMRWGSGD